MNREQFMRLRPSQRARLSIGQEMAPVIHQAKKDGQVFYQPYSGRWYTPERMRQMLAAGLVVMGRRHWQLRDKFQMPLTEFGAV